jgi:hypothetical protein
MPQLLSEDDFGQTIQTDDGNIVTVPRGMADPASMTGLPGALSPMTGLRGGRVAAGTARSGLGGSAA